MAYVPPSDRTPSQLAVQIMGSVDIAGIIGRSITLSDDIAKATQKLNEINVATQAMFTKASNDALSKARGTGLAIVTEAKKMLFQDINMLNTFLRNQAGESAAGYGMLATMTGQEAKIYSITNDIDLKTKALIDIPEGIALYNVQKYYNKLLTPNRPSESDLVIQVKNKWIPTTDYCNWLQEVKGLNTNDATSVLSIREQQVGKPNLNTYWIMARKGLVSESDWLMLARVGYGYTEKDAKALWTHLFYTFSPMELFRISDLTPTSATWISKKLDELGLTPDDKNIMANLIQARTLKDEISQAWSLLINDYSWGLTTKTELAEFLTDNNVPEIQADAKLAIADQLREKVIMKLMRDAEIYLYRKDVANENQLLTALQDLNIELDVANAITRNEACKKGIDWEMPP